jgi:Spy/CpxP family protein refolding chaperone
VKFSSASHFLVFATVFAIAWQPRAEAQAAPVGSITTRVAAPCGAPLEVVRTASPAASPFLTAGPDEYAEPLLSIMALLSGFTLSEKQEDQIFTIIHDASPSVRQNAKQLTKAYVSLRKLTFSSEYSKTAMDALVRAVGDATAQSAQLHAQLEHDIAGVLTTEQRRALQEPGRGEDRGNCSQNCSTTEPHGR